MFRDVPCSWFYRRPFLEAHSRFEKISFEIGFDTKHGSFLLIFKCKWIDLALDKTSSFLSIIVSRYILPLQKAVGQSVG